MQNLNSYTADSRW